jgi:hypothetical protein
MVLPPSHRRNLAMTARRKIQLAGFTLEGLNSNGLVAERLRILARHASAW